MSSLAMEKKMTPNATVAPKKKSHYNQRVGRTIGDIVIYLILIVMSVIWLAPIIWLILQSFGADYGYSNNTRWFPDHWGVTAYIELWKGLAPTSDTATTGIYAVSLYNFFGYVGGRQVTNLAGVPEFLSDGVTPLLYPGEAGRFYPGAFLNTLWVALATMIISTLFCLQTSYAFSRLRFKARTKMMKFILIMGMFPSFLGMIILYWIFKDIHFGDNYPFYQSMWALVIIYSGGAGMGYYISKGFFDTISKQIDEAAMVDGASRWQIFYKITLPLSKPIVVYTALTSFMGPWAEYITASYIMGPQKITKDNWTVAVTLWTMLNASELPSRTPYWTQFCAGAVLVAVPTSLLFMFMQKYYVSGVTGGAVKG
jgi:arabinogalactan oligomer/maltooligosaccharide transport system permease protein